jgi:hypothetical protein
MTDLPNDRGAVEETRPERSLKGLTVRNYDALGLAYPKPLGDDYEIVAVELDERVLEPGDLLVLPPGQRCRAYRGPRHVDQAARFLAVYPTEGAGPGHMAVW